MDFEPFRIDFQSKKVDLIIHNILKTLHSVLITSRKNKIDQFAIEELRCGKTFFYIIENAKNGRRGYIGRNINTGRVSYIALDKSRLKWAEMEGFTEESGYSLKFIYENIGALRKAKSLSDFVNFLDGQPEVAYFEGYYTLPDQSLSPVRMKQPDSVL